MGTSVVFGKDEFESGCEQIEATSMHRPDESWRFVDAKGHLHHWCDADGQPLMSYHPTTKCHVPSLQWVHDGVGYWEDGEEYEKGHHECAVCGETIEPRYTADDCRQFNPGLRWCRINGQIVSPEVFRSRLKEAGYGH